MNEVFTAKEAAEYLGVKIVTLKRWRQRGTGPAYARLAHNVIRYMRSDIDAWIKSHIDAVA